MSNRVTSDEPDFWYVPPLRWPLPSRSFNQFQYTFGAVRYAWQGPCFDGRGEIPDYVGGVLIKRNWLISPESKSFLCPPFCDQAICFVSKLLVQEIHMTCNFPGGGGGAHWHRRMELRERLLKRGR